MYAKVCKKTSANWERCLQLITSQRVVVIALCYLTHDVRPAKQK